ncbi:MAG: hypothetical protein J5U19_05025 [Candidatus Methanoperedens sp.]|nr:hypothetical protein [Candidatus Methanoperedens sp.]
MKNSIKYGIILLSCLVLISQASAAEVTVVPLNKTLTQGEIFTLNISIDPQGAAIAGAQLNIEFDRSMLQVNNIMEGNILKQNGENTFFNKGIIDNSHGTFKDIYCVILGTVNVAAPGTFILVNITAGSPGQSRINLSNVKIVDPDGNYVDLKVINGSVNITSINMTSMIGIENLSTKNIARKNINWAWTDPSTPDFARVMVYINGKFITNVTKGIGHYQADRLTPKTRYIISTHTVNTSGIVSTKWVNNTARTV